MLHFFPSRVRAHNPYIANLFFASIASIDGGMLLNFRLFSCGGELLFASTISTKNVILVVEAKWK